MTRAWLFALCVGCSFHPGETIDSGMGSGSGSNPDSSTCTPGDKSCVGRDVRTCGADGSWDATQDFGCEFTCANGACVAPSNIDLPTVATCGAGAPVLDPGPTGTVTYQNNPGPQLSCSPACGTTMTIAPTEVVGNEAWFCVSSINVQVGATLVASASQVPTNAIGFIVDGAATIAGRIALDGTNAVADGNPNNDGPATPAGPGGSPGANQDDSNGKTGGGSGGGGGGAHKDCPGDNWVGAGGGGGGDFEIGANGGSALCSDNSNVAAGLPGPLAYNAGLVPLVGGGGGGGGGDATPNGGYGWAGGGGGGAVQIAARLSISIGGEISARGGNGYGGSTQIDGGGGGGAGGGVLLESPLVTIGGAVVVDGGNGGLGAAGAGGTGATGTHAAQPGATSSSTMLGGGGGGGGGGIVQIRSVAAACAAGVSPEMSCMVGMLAASAD
ncbi:MAG TPA: hypothetical protein VGG74_07220 [Kofleriaceae bacterium]